MKAIFLVTPLTSISCHTPSEQIPHEMVTQSRNSYVDAEVHAPTLEELGKQMAEESGNYQTYLEGLMLNLGKEAKEKFKGWVTCSSIENTDLCYRKVISATPEQQKRGELRGPKEARYCSAGHLPFPRAQKSGGLQPSSTLPHSEMGKSLSVGLFSSPAPSGLRSMPWHSSCTIVNEVPFLVCTLGAEHKLCMQKVLGQ